MRQEQRVVVLGIGELVGGRGGVVVTAMPREVMRIDRLISSAALVEPRQADYLPWSGVLDDGRRRRSVAKRRGPARRASWRAAAAALLPFRGVVVLEQLSLRSSDVRLRSLECLLTPIPLPLVVDRALLGLRPLLVGDQLSVRLSLARAEGRRVVVSLNAIVTVNVP